jgi:hypothetical protein
LSAGTARTIGSAASIALPSPAPHNVAHAIQFGFDVDTLKILLHELIDVVDKFFIVEWTMPHNQNLNPNPLAWEAVKGQAWFAFAQGKIVHINIGQCQQSVHNCWEYVVS